MWLIQPPIPAMRDLWGTADAECALQTAWLPGKVKRVSKSLSSHWYDCAACVFSLGSFFFFFFPFFGALPFKDAELTRCHHCGDIQTGFKSIPPKDERPCASCFSSGPPEDVLHFSDQLERIIVGMAHCSGHSAEPGTNNTYPSAARGAKRQRIKVCASLNEQQHAALNVGRANGAEIVARFRVKIDPFAASEAFRRSKKVRQFYDKLKKKKHSFV